LDDVSSEARGVGEFDGVSVTEESKVAVPFSEPIWDAYYQSRGGGGEPERGIELLDL
jgi:hypothetical protein